MTASLSTIVSKTTQRAAQYPLHTSLSIIAPIGYWIYSRFATTPTAPALPPIPVLPLPNSIISIVASYEEFADIELVVSKILSPPYNRSVIYNAMQEQANGRTLGYAEYIHMHDLRQRLTPVELPDILQMNLEYFADVPAKKLNIHSIELSSSDNSNNLREIIKTCPNLKSLDLSQCDWVTDDDLILLANSGLPIKELSLVWKTDTLQDGRGLKALKKLPLKTVNLSGEFLTDDQVKVLANLNLPIKKLYLLGSLISKVGIQNLIDSNPLLEKLYLPDCVLIDDDAIQILAESNLPLTELDISNIPNITDAIIFLLAKGKKLNKLLLKHTRITDAGIHALAESELPLNELNLSFCSISDESIKALAFSQQHIKTLHLHGCPNITEHSLPSFIHGPFTYIDLSYPVHFNLILGKQELEGAGFNCRLEENQFSSSYILIATR